MCGGILLTDGERFTPPNNKHPQLRQMCPSNRYSLRLAVIFGGIVGVQHETTDTKDAFVSFLRALHRPNIDISSSSCLRLASLALVLLPVNTRFEYGPAYLAQF